MEELMNHKKMMKVRKLPILTVTIPSGKAKWKNFICNVFTISTFHLRGIVTVKLKH